MSLCYKSFHTSAQCPVLKRSDPDCSVVILRPRQALLSTKQVVSRLVGREIPATCNQANILEVSLFLYVTYDQKNSNIGF